VDNTCKAALDDVAQAMKSQADTGLVIVGDSDAAETRKNLARRKEAVNSKAYLVGGEAKLGIDPTRIETRTGTSGGQRAEFLAGPCRGDVQSIRHPDSGMRTRSSLFPITLAPRKGNSVMLNMMSPVTSLVPERFCRTSRIGSYCAH